MDILLIFCEQYKATISQLSREVKELENDKKVMQASVDKINARPNKDTCPESAKSVQMLRDKIKKLEEKQKELRKKEIEYAKLLQQKEKACKEVTALKTELVSSKRQQVEAQKRQRKEAEKYAEERKKLTLQENQSRRKEIQALEKASKISIELSNKDRVMKTKLEEKEREIKRLKSLSEKQEKVKAHREQVANRSNSSQVSKGVSLKKGISRTDELTKSQVDLLQNWIIKEVEMQSARIVLREEIREQTEQRAATYQKIVALKHERESDGTSALVTVAGRSEEEIARENDIKNLEKELMRMGIELSQANGRLDNLGHDMDTRRFRNITDLKETKILLNTLFQKLANEKVVEKRAMDQKLSAQEQELVELRAKLAQYEPVAAPLTVTKKPRPVPEGVLGIQGGPQREKIIRKGPTVHKSSKHSRIPTGSLKAPLDTNLSNLKKSHSSVSNKSNKSIGSIQQDDGDDLDATFDDYDLSDYDDRDESYIDLDDDDSEYEETPRATSKGRKRTSKDSDGQDDTSSSDGSRKKSRGSSGDDDSIMSEEADMEEPTFPLEKYKVPELKKFLSNKSLPVSGECICVCDS
jgi:myosin heavy subunit